MTKVLVAYASKYNATAEIAQAIGKTLQEFQLFDVDVRSVELVEDITSYDAVVLGSAVYAGQWLSSAADFLTSHEQILSQRPVWLFSSGPAGEVDTEIKTKEWKFPQALTSVAARINPRAIEVFQGKLDLSRLNFLERYITRLVKAPRGDFRDWDVIRTWSIGIEDALKVLELQSVQHA
jgi:menaquinone-dependent protoporphyrinogen oxidase